jgi:hypothetical protein
MHVNQVKSFLTLLIVFCSAASVGQVKKTAPSSAQRQPPPVVQQTSPNGGMLQPRQPSSALRPALLGNDVEQMTKAQFRALPDTATLRYKGQAFTKASYIGLRLREFQAQARTTQPQASFEMIKAHFQQQQTADLATRNARVQAVMDAFNARTKQIESSAAYATLEKEASDLQRRFAHSNAAQQAQLKQRALDIHNQLLDMEQRAK